MPTNGSHNKGSHNKGSHNTVWPQPLKMSNKIVISIVACWLEQSSHALISGFRDSIRSWSRQAYPCIWQKYTSILQSERFSFNTNRMNQNSVKGLMNNNAKVSSFTKHISKGFINVALGAITNLKMNMPHGVRCIAKGLDHRNLWTTSSPKQSDWHNGNGCASSLLLKRNPTSAGLAIIANIEKVITKL